MKKFILAFLFLVLFAPAAFAKKPDACTTIQSGELYGSDGSLLTTGYNEWGYNYQAQMFNGMWCDYHPHYRPGGGGHDWCMENMSEVELSMKWNGAWLSNKDCDGDFKLDRHYGFSSYIGSGAWLTNHESLSGNEGYNYFVKIVAAPEGAIDSDPAGESGIWTLNDIEIGPEIWNAFAVIQEVGDWSDPSFHGLFYKSPLSPGLGFYMP